MNQFHSEGVRGRTSIGLLAILTLAVGAAGSLAWISCSKGDEPAAKTPDTSQSGSASATDAAKGTASAPAPIDPATAGTIRGTVKFDGTPPVREKVLITSECSKPGKDGILKEEIVVNANGTLRNVFVYIKDGLGNRTFEAPAEPALLDQVGCVYTPHVIGVQTGQQLLIRNSDGTTHNVNAAAGKSKGFNEAMLPGAGDLKARFKLPELRKLVKCDIHPWMNAWIHIMNHPYFGVTGDAGTFEFKNVPPGKYTIEAVHEMLGAKTLTIEIGAKDTKTADFTFQK